MSTPRLLRSPALAGLLGAAGLAFGACGASESPTILDTEKVERAIERSSMDQRDLRVRVSCPSGVRQAKDRAFSCTASYAGRSARFDVAQLDDAGRVRYVAR